MPVAAAASLGLRGHKQGRWLAQPLILALPQAKTQKPCLVLALGRVSCVFTVPFLGLSMALDTPAWPGVAARPRFRRWVGRSFLRRP